MGTTWLYRGYARPIWGLYGSGIRGPFYSKIPIDPIFYLLKGDYNFHVPRAALLRCVEMPVNQCPKLGSLCTKEGLTKGFQV